MESFGNFLKFLSESLNRVETQEVQVQQTTEEIKKVMPSNESGYVSQSSSRRSSENENEEKIRRMRRIRNQAREDDDEEFEASGRRRINNDLQLANNNGVGATGAAVGIAAIALGTYAIGKIFFSSADVPKFSTSSEEIIDAIKKIEDDTKEFPVVGMDCQWTHITTLGSKRNKIALLQLCSSEGNLAIIPINKIYTYPEALKAFLRNQRIIKVGIETLKDARYLLEDYGLNVTSTYDIRYLAEDCGHQPLGLEKLSERILGLDLGRDWELIVSDWDKEPLDDNQKSYAEKSVKASIDIFKALIPFVVSKINRNEILNYCYEHVDRAFVYYSHRY